MNATPAEEIAYVKSAYDFANKNTLIKMAGVRKAFTVFLYGRQEIYLTETDKRLRRVSSDLTDAIIPFFIKMFKVGSNMHWRDAARFNGCLRKTSRREIAANTDLGPGQLQLFLRLIKDHKLIDCEYSWDPQKKKNQWMLIKINFQRLNEMLQLAYEWACDHRLFGLRRKTMVKVEVFLDECLKKQIDVNSTVCSEDLSGSASSEVCSDFGTKKENNPTASPGVNSSFLNKKVTIEVDNYTNSVLVHLRRAFDHREFTISSVRKVQRLVNAWLPWKKMIESDVVDFVRLREAGDDTWLSKEMDLDFLISRWASIKTHVQKRLTEDNAAASRTDLEHYDPVNIGNLLTESLNYLRARISLNPSRAFDILTDFAGSNCHMLHMVNAIRLAPELGFDQHTVLGIIQEQFRQVVLQSPRYFTLLEKLFPIRKWAGLKEYACSRLREQSYKDSLEDLRLVAAHEVHCAYTTDTSVTKAIRI